MVASLIVSTILFGALAAQAGTLTLASTKADGTKGNATSDFPSLSADGTTVAFTSFATNLVDADTDSFADVYIKDLTTGALTLASTKADGTKGNGASFNVSLSGDGTKVAFLSLATNLDPGDTDSSADVYVKNLTTGALTLASTTATGTKGNSASGVVSLSGDGTKVAFDSASNLDPGDTDSVDIYVKNLTTGALTLASTSTGGTKGNQGSVDPSLSEDGTEVAFRSNAFNLDPGDTDGTTDVYVKNLTTGALTLASTSTGGTKSNADSFVPSLSGDSTKVAFYSGATNLGDTDSFVDIYVKNLTTGALTLASTSTGGTKGNADSADPRLSGDGTQVAFRSSATNLDPGDTDSVVDIYVKDLSTGAIALASTSTGGTKGNNVSLAPSLSENGAEVAFYSFATNLDPGDTDSSQDVYVNVLVDNSPPTVDAGGDVIGTEGSAIALDATVTDTDGDTVTTTWTVAGGDPCTFDDPGAIDTTITCTDDGTFTATLTADDGVNAPVTDTTQVTVTNAGGGGGGGGGGGPPPPPPPVDPGVLEFPVEAYSVMEGEGSARIEVTRTGGSDGTLSVVIATADGTAKDGNRKDTSHLLNLRGTEVIPPDYSAVSGTLIFVDGESSKSFLVPIEDDPRVEGTETVHLTIASPLGGATLGSQQAAVLNIVDNDPNVSFKKARSTIDEDTCRNEGRNGNMCELDLRVLLSTPVPRDVTVNYAVAGGTATPSTDYVLGAGTLTFPRGLQELRAASQEIHLSIRKDDQREEAETITAELSAPTSGALGPIPTHRVTIAPSDPQGDLAGGSPDTAYAVDLGTRPRQIIQESVARGSGDNADMYKVHLDAGDDVAIDVDPLGRGAQLLTSSTLTVLDSDGVREIRVVGRSPEPDGSGITDNPAYLFHAPAEGDYYLRLTTTERGARAYDIELHHLALAQGLQDPAHLDVKGPMFVWMRGPSLAITGPTGYGFALEGEWVKKTTFNSRANLSRSVYKLARGKEVTLVSAPRIQVGPARWLELQLTVVSDIVVSTEANRWGDVFGRVSGSSIRARVRVPLGELSNEFADAFGFLVEQKSGLELDTWTIQLGREILSSSVGHDREIREVLKGIPYFFSIDHTPAGGPIFKVEFGPIDTTTSQNGTILIMDPADPFFYINWISGATHLVAANSSSGFVPFHPALPPTLPEAIGLDDFYGHSFAIAEAPIFEVFPGAKPNSFQADAHLTLGATRNIDLDADDDGAFLAGRGNAHQLLSGELSAFGDVLRDVNVGANADVTFVLKKSPFNFDVSLGEASLILNGQEESVWFRARKGAENPLAGTPFSFLGMSPQDEFEGVFFNDGRFTVVGGASLDLPGDSGFNVKLQIDNRGVAAEFDGLVKFSGSAEIGGVNASCSATAAAAGDLAFSMSGGNLRMLGSLRSDGSLKCYVGGQKVASASFDVSGRIEDGRIVFRLPYIGEESISLF